jgi:hypothetical protein
MYSSKLKEVYYFAHLVGDLKDFEKLMSAACLKMSRSRYFVQENDALCIKKCNKAVRYFVCIHNQGN